MTAPPDTTAPADLTPADAFAILARHRVTLRKAARIAILDNVAAMRRTYGLGEKPRLSL